MLDTYCHSTRTKCLTPSKFMAKKPYDVTGGIIAYETGELDHEEVVELFQHLVDTGLAWQLQGHYGRTARQLIDCGYVNPRSNKP
jgi:hypothetical protein